MQDKRASPWGTTQAAKVKGGCWAEAMQTSHSPNVPGECFKEIRVNGINHVSSLKPRFGHFMRLRGGGA